jgi:reversibly glycosylated polypeptide/UDP-arabinopyranose mutase
LKSVLVVPTIRDVSFLTDWRPQLERCHVIVCEDGPERTVELPPGIDGVVYSWREIDAELGADAWIISRRSSAIRSFGFWKAWQQTPDMIVTLDDDCYPLSDRLFDGHWLNLQRRVTLGWAKTAPFYTRGFPYLVRDAARVALSHGLWLGVPDLDAPTQLVNPSLRIDSVETAVIPRGTYFPMCGMNLAFAPEITPAMYFLLMGSNWQFDRFDDIWAGVFAKKICDHLGLAVVSGQPAVEHRRASNVFTNLRKEAAGIEANESVWRAVDAVRLDARDVKGCYIELADRLPLEGEYWDRLREAMRIWGRLF